LGANGLIGDPFRDIVSQYKNKVNFHFGKQKRGKRGYNTQDRTGELEMVQGKILNYNSDIRSGFLRDESENRYHFFSGDCTNPEKLKMGSDVMFEHDGEKATLITVIESINDISASEVKLTKETSVKKSKKIISILLILMLIVAIGGLVVIQRVSVLQDQKLEEVEKKYESQIENINKYLLDNECSKALLEYSHANETRNEIYKHGTYYSIETHAQHAHAIDIAECFSNKKDYKSAVIILDTKNVNNPDYLNRASVIYKKAGDKQNAQDAHTKAQAYLP
jgi:tetratricopeptide (TPR) repeat protein